MRIDGRGPVTTWLYAERYLGGGTRSYSRYSADMDLSARFHPVHGTDSFTVPTFWIDPEQGGWLSNRIDSAVPELYREGGAVLLPVHPETLTVPGLSGRAVLEAAQPGPPLQVVPTANARTVFVERRAGQPVAPHFVKLHYPKRLSRFTRRLRRQVIALQLWVAQELHAMDAPFLPEVAGGVLGDHPVHAWGYLLREPAPRTGRRLPYTVPLFALYGQDVRAPQDPSVLEQLVAASGQDPFDWVTQRLVEPMISLWCQVLLRTGIALELHGQNTLVCFSDDLRDTRVVVRDCAVYVDPALRQAAGLAAGLPPRNVISQDVDKPRGQVFSLVYDSFLGEHALSYVARLLHRRFGVEPARLHRFARAVFARHPEVAELMTPTVFYYNDRLPVDGQWHLVDTGATPRWR